jgi:hypothetical protein
MAGLIAIAASFLAFVVPLAIPLFARGWRSFGVMVVLATAFFAWLSDDVQRAALGNREGMEPTVIGSFLGGLMLIGFAFGTIAKFAMLIGRPKTSETDSTTR